MRTEQTNDLFIGLSPTRLFFTAALPGAVSMLASALYDLADGIMVGQIMGESAFAAVNLAMPFVILLFAVGDMVGVGSSVPISISLGEGDGDRANDIFSGAVLLIAVLGGAAGLALFLAAPHIMVAMGATGRLARMATVFLQVYAVFSPISSLMFAIDNFLRICGRIRGSLLLNLFMAGFGAVCEFSLLYFFHLGIFGAALGYCLALALSVLIGLWPFMRGRMQLRFVRPHLTLSLVREICASGAPALLNNVASRVVSVMLFSALLRLGGERAVATYGVLGYASGVAYPLIYGMNDSLQPALGYNWGAGRVDRVVKIEKRVIAASACVALAVAGVMVAAPDQLTRLFMADADADLLALSHRALRLYAIAWLFEWLPMSAISFLTALKRPVTASTLSLVKVLVLPLVALLVLGPLGLDGLWLNQPASTMVATLICGLALLELRRELRGQRGLVRGTLR